MVQATRSRPAVFYPSHLTLYRQCPERYFHKYVERRKVAEPFSPALARGNVAHAILAECFDQYRRQRTFPIDLQERVEALLPPLPYPDDRAWRFDVATVLDHVKFALMEFDGTSRLLATEGTYDYPYPGGRDCPPFILRAKVDRVLHHPDGGLEHTDYKTGREQAIDPIQNVASRIVVRHNFGGDYAYIRSSTMFLASLSTRSDDLTREQVQVTWREIKQTASAILSATEWPPVRSALCEWCPFYGSGCSLDPAAGEGDAMAEWLDGAA